MKKRYLSVQEIRRVEGKKAIGHCPSSSYVKAFEQYKIAHKKYHDAVEAELERGRLNRCLELLIQ